MRRTLHHAGMTVRPSLPPGAVVLRHDARTLVVGTEPGVLVPDRQGLTGLLRLVDGVRDRDQLSLLADPAIAAEVPAVVDELLVRGALVDRPVEPRPALDVALRSEAVLRPLATATETVLEQLDLAPGGMSAPGLVVLISSREPARSIVDELARGGVPHLVVVAGGSRPRVGPLVVPGLSPCLTCLDHARAELDPAWPAMLTQLEGPPLATGPPLLHGPQLWRVAALIGGEVASLARGGRPATAGALLHVGPDLTAAATSQPLPFHHRCGCWLLGRD